MDLKAKLRRLTSAGPESRPPTASPSAPTASPSAPTASPSAVEGPRPSTAASADSGRLRRRLATFFAAHPPLPPPPEIQRALPGELHQTSQGPLHRIEALLPPGHCHGQAPVAGALRADRRLVSQLALDPKLAAVELERMLLLDTETTGLAGGTGTLPFLIGLGWFEGGRLRLSQLLLRRPGEEGPMLHALAGALKRASCVVTYNGKCFDWPLLRNRFVMNRLSVPHLPPHLDLLHCARRVFRRRLSEMRLGQVEEAVLGHCRQGDIDGSEIPERYFDYLRSGDGGSLAAVIDHNGQDLVALAGLLGTLAERFAAAGSGADARDSLGFAQVAWRTEDPDRALAFARAAATGSPGELAADALALVAQLARKRGDLGGAARALEEAVGNAAPGSQRSAGLSLALAKLYEHQFGDPLRALAHAQAARTAEAPAAHLRRISRLQARLAQTGRNRAWSF